jgi:small nuclear ribonucleoprotein (snRNP)-like protein
MILHNYINKKVQIVLNNGFTYVGTVTETDSDSLVLIDKYNKTLTLKAVTINFIKELQ